MKIAILGSSSFIGDSIKKYLLEINPSNEIFEFSRTNGNLNLTPSFDHERFAASLLEINPEVLINCVGIGEIKEYSKTSRSLLERDFLVNSEFPSFLFSNLEKFKDLKFAMSISSVSSDLPSPLFSSYAASKAYSSKFIESINAENFVKNSDVVITDAHLFNFKSSTNFSGGSNSATSEEVNRIKKCVDAMFAKQRTFYEENFKEVLERSASQYEQFVKKSFDDKISRTKSNKIENIGYLTGSFDAFHFGHINLIRRAASLCDKLVIGIHENGKRKNVDFIHSLEERIANLKSLRFVSEVIVSSGEDDKDWEKVKYSSLFVGTDYQGTERFERYEKSLDGKARIIYLPRTEGVSSTQIRERQIK